MAEEELQKILMQLEDHEKRIRALENGEVESSTKKKPAELGRKVKSKGEDLYLPIEKLVQNGFFNETRIDLDVVSELQRRLLTRKKPLRASVVNVLRKMVRDGVLERMEAIKKEKTFIAYKKS